MLLFLLGPLTAMAQVDVTDFTPKGPKVKQVVVTSYNAKQRIYLFDSMGRNYAEGERACDTCPFTFEPLDTVSPLFNRTKQDDATGMTIDSLFRNYYIRDIDSLCKGRAIDDCPLTEEELFIYDTAILLCISYIDENNLTRFTKNYDGQGLLTSTRHFLYDHRNNITKSISYSFNPNEGVKSINIIIYNKKGHIIEMDSRQPDGTKIATHVFKLDRHGNITLDKRVHHNVPHPGGKNEVYKLRYKYKYDKHGNWTSCHYHDRRNQYSTCHIREITYWE